MRVRELHVATHTQTHTQALLVEHQSRTKFRIKKAAQCLFSTIHCSALEICTFAFSYLFLSHSEEGLT